MGARSGAATRNLVGSLAFLAVAFVLVGLVGSLTPQRGLDLADGTRLTFTTQEPPTAGQLERAAEVAADRLDSAGIVGARVTVAGPDRVIVEHPGASRSEVAPMLAREGRLRIRVVARSGPGALASPTEGESEDDPASGDDAGAGDDAREDAEADPATDYGDPVVWAVSPDQASVEAYEAHSCGDASVERPDAADAPHLACDASGTKYLLSPVVVEGERLSNATARVTPGTTEWGVRLRFDGDGSRAFADMSRILAGTQRLFAVVLDGDVVAAPRMTSVVANGEANITGSFTEDGARALATSLDSGTMPLPLTSEPVTESVPAGVDRGSALTWGAVGLGLLLLMAFAVGAPRGRLGLALPAALAATFALGYAAVVLLSEGTGLVVSAATLAGLAPALLLVAFACSALLADIGAGVARGQSVGVATDSAVRRSRPSAALAAALPLTAAVVVYAVSRGVLAEFALALGLATVVATAVHLVFTTSLVQWLGAGGGDGRGLTVPTFSVSAVRRRGYALAAVVLVVGVVGLVARSPQLAAEVTDAAGQTSWRWLAGGLVVVAALAATLLTHRFGSWRFAVAGLVAVLVDLVVVAGVAALLGVPVTYGTVAAALAVLALSLRDKVAAFDAVEHPLDGPSGKRRALTESVDLAVRGSLVAARGNLTLAGIPLLGLVVIGLLLGGLGPLTEVALVLLIGLVVSTGTALFVAAPLLVDLRAKVRQVRATSGRTSATRPVTATATKRRTSSPKGPSRTAAASRGPVRQSGSAKRMQPSRQTRAKRGKK